MKLRNKRTDADLSEPIHILIQRLDQMPGGLTRIITFIAARRREGTSTVARHYAETLAAQTNQQVLLIDAGPLVSTRFIDPSRGVIDLTVSLPGNAIQPTSNGVALARWGGNNEDRGLAGRMVHDPVFWENLLKSYGAIVIDAPALQTAFDGVVLAARSDAVVMVVESENTPEPVVHNLRDTLSSAGAKIAGVVMNKRHYYIPDNVYRHL